MIFIEIIQLAAILCLLWLIFKYEAKIKCLEENKPQYPIVYKHKRKSPHRLSDPVVEVIVAENKGLAFSDSEWKKARERFLSIRSELPIEYKDIS